MESLRSVSLSDWNSNKWPLEKGYCSTPCGVELKYKRQKVAAIRDFPPGCGRNATRINLSPPETGVALMVTDKIPDVVVADGVKITEIGVESVSHEAMRSPIQMEMTQSLDDLVRKVVGTAGTVSGVEKLSIDVEPLGLEVELPKDLANNVVELSKELYEVEVGALVEEESNEGELQDLVEVQAVVKNVGAPENKTVLEIEAPLDGAIRVRSAKLGSPPKWPISDANVPDGTVPKNKYHHRRIAATRSFPPFCRRNAPRPTEEDCPRIASGKNSMDAVGGGGGVEGGTLGGTVWVVGEDSEGNVRDGNVHKGESKNIVLEPRNNSSTNGDARNRVRETLRLFQALCRKILQGEESKSRQGEEGRSPQHRKDVKRIDLLAAKIIKEKGKEVNTGKQIVGAVPGVEVGDQFHYRVELAIVGVHRLYQSGIDYVKLGKQIVATSIVASGGYDDELDNADVLIYSGQGGNLMGKDKQPEDQKLQRGNLALKNSISAKNPVRVIKGSRVTKSADSLDARAQIVLTYVYDGLYMVEKYWQEIGPHGKLVFKFELRRISGQPELA